MSDLQYYQQAKNLLDNRVILVTGATSGIGRAVSHHLTQHGARVIVHGRDPSALKRLHKELSEIGLEPIVAKLDFENAHIDEYHNLTKEIETRFNRLDGLLHNASILGDLTPIGHYNINLWQRVMQTNLNAPFILTRYFLPLLRRSEDASILFTTSGVGNNGRAHWGAYCASKFATEGLAQTLADECENTSIRVNSINPGATRTLMRSKAFPAEDPKSLQKPESITKPYLYLLGPDSRGTSGQRFECQPTTPPLT